MPSLSSVSRGLNPSLSLPLSSLPTPQLSFRPPFSFPPTRWPRPRFLHLRTARQTAMRMERGTDMAAAIKTELLMWRSGRIGAALAFDGTAFELGREAGIGEGAEDGAPEQEQSVSIGLSRSKGQKLESESEGRVSARRTRGRLVLCIVR